MSGSFVQKETLKKCSPIAYFFIDKLHEIMHGKKNKKSAAYIENINTQFGLNQYMEILNENGFIQFGKKPNSRTMCSICGKVLQDHTRETKLHYKPAVYSIYSNAVSETQRKIQKDIFNSYQNKNGEEIALIMLTSIAETGLTLKCVNNFFILDNIPEISLFDQIVARAVRLKSHMDVHPEDRFVNIYCLTISSPGLSDITKHE